MIIFLRREALEVTVWTTKWAQIPVSVFGATLPMLSKVDKASFEVPAENFSIYVNMGIWSKIPPEREASMCCFGGLLKCRPCGKRSLDRVILGVFCSRIHEKKAIILDDIHFAVKLVNRAVIDFGCPVKSNASAE